MSSKRKYYGTSGEYALTEEEVHLLIDSIGHYEDQALIALAIATGIRREDIVAIPISGVDIEMGWITYYEQKKDRTWKVPVGGNTQAILKRYLQTIPPGSRWLFPKRTHPQKHISGRTAYNMLQRWLKQAGLKGRPFHALRSTCVKLAKKRGWSVSQTMALTGDTARTIQEHYETPTSEEMSEVASKKSLL